MPYNLFSEDYPGKRMKALSCTPAALAQPRVLSPGMRARGALSGCAEQFLLKIPDPFFNSGCLAFTEEKPREVP